MISASAEYRKAIVGDSRRMLLRAIIDIVDPDIVYGEAQSESESKYSRDEELHDKDFDNPPKYATLETDRWLLDGTWRVFPDDVNDCLPGIAYASDSLSGDDGAFPTAQYVELRFSNVSILQGCSVYFPDNEYDGYPVDFTVEVKQGGTAYHTVTYTGNASTNVTIDGFTVYNPDAIRVTVTKWSMPSRRMRVVEIVPGIYERWDGDMLASFALKHQGDVSCVSLPYGTCTVKIDNQSRRFEPRKKNGVFQSIEERQGIDVSMACRLPDGTDEYKRLGIFYQHSGGWKTGDNGLTIQWDLVDIVGLLSDREFIAPDTLPTTLEGWIAALVAQLGVNFEGRYTVDPAYASKSVTVRENADVEGQKCGDLLRYVCMATGTWPRADAETGYLAAEPLWDQGNKITLDNLVSYPTMKANSDISSIIFTLNDGNSTKYVVSGNFTASSDTVSVENPFIKTQADALTAAKLILAAYGGNRIEIIGRGDPTSEIGDVDTVWLDGSSATAGRRMQQTFQITNGVLQGCQSVFLQADGAFLFDGYAVLTGSGQWTAPAEAGTTLRVILVGGGAGGASGAPGTWEAAGVDGTDGQGGMVWAGTITINPQQTFSYSCGAGGGIGQPGGSTTFGSYSSANGQNFDPNYTDIASGNAYARDGVPTPIPGTGDGGKSGKGGVKGNRHEETIETQWSWETIWVVDNEPGFGEPGAPGASGCIVVYWSKGGD